MSDPSLLAHPTAMETDELLHTLPPSLKRSTSAPMIVEAVQAANPPPPVRIVALTALDLANATPAPPRRVRSSTSLAPIAIAPITSSSVPSSPSMVVEPRVWELKRESGLDDCVKQEVAHERGTTLTLQLVHQCEEMSLDNGRGRSLYGVTRSFPSSPVLPSPCVRRSSFSGFLRSQSPLLSDHRPDSLSLKRKHSLDNLSESFASPPKRYCSVRSPLLVDAAGGNVGMSDSDSGRGASPLRPALIGLYEQSPLNESGPSAAQSSASSIDGSGVPVLLTSGSFSIDFTRHMHQFGSGGGGGFKFGGGNGAENDFSTMDSQ